jgi:hypothetical protein
MTGRLTIAGHFALSRTTVRVVGTFLWYYRIEAIEPVWLSDHRCLRAGERTLVPQWAVRRVRVETTSGDRELESA